MKKSKKMIWIGLGSMIFLLLVIVVLFLVFRSNSKSPNTLTRKYMNRYLHLDNKVVEKIKYPFGDSLTSKQKSRYQEIIKKQYKDMTYDIVKEEVNEADAVITVNFSVYDLKSAMDKAVQYIEAYPDRFRKEGVLQGEKVVDYKLDILESYRDRITYSVSFTYYKKDGAWELMDLSNTDLEKLDGIY